MPKLNKLFLDKIKLQKVNKVHFDDEIKGLGLRVQGSSISWIIMYRNTENRQRMLTIGKANILTPEMAREMAKIKLAEILHGDDPANSKLEARKAMSVAELCDLYVEQGISHKKASTIKIDMGRIKRHIIPLIGKIRLKSLNREIIEKMMLDITKGNIPKDKSCIRNLGGKFAAKRTLETFGAILQFAHLRDLIPSNPVYGIKKPKGNKKDIHLSLEELSVLGKAITTSANNKDDKTSINAILLLALTGCRKSEIISLTWNCIDLKEKCFRFEDTKTGKQTRPFGQGALNLLTDLYNNKQNKSPFVFPSKISNSHIIGIPKAFRRVLGYIEDKDITEKNITLHTLRHTFASIAAQIGYSELTIAGLLGHRLGGVTNRYSHLPDKSLISAADNVSSTIERSLNNDLGGDNIIEFKII